jgi:hypothetical protein
MFMQISHKHTKYIPGRCNYIPSLNSHTAYHSWVECLYLQTFFLAVGIKRVLSLASYRPIQSVDHCFNCCRFLNTQSAMYDSFTELPCDCIRQIYMYRLASRIHYPSMSFVNLFIN